MNGLAWLIVGAALGVGGTLGVQYATRHYRVSKLSGAAQPQLRARRRRR